MTLDFDSSNTQIISMISKLEAELTSLRSIWNGLWIAFGALCNVHSIDKFKAVNGQLKNLPEGLQALSDRIEWCDNRTNSLENAIAALRAINTVDLPY